MMQGGGGEEVSIEELASNLSTYKEQLHQVRQLLANDPRNSEYVDMERELLEVIALTEELLATSRQNEISPDVEPRASESPTLPYPKGNQMELGSVPDHHEKFSIGTKVQAVWSEDGEWYDATIEAFTPIGYFVSYDEWGNKEEVDPANVRPVQYDVLLEAERVAEATKQAIKRKIAQAASVDFQSRSLPAKLHIEPDDPEDVLQLRGRGSFSSSELSSLILPSCILKVFGVTVRNCPNGPVFLSLKSLHSHNKSKITSKIQCIYENFSYFGSVKGLRFFCY